MNMAVEAESRSQIHSASTGSVEQHAGELCHRGELVLHIDQSRAHTLELLVHFRQFVGNTSPP